jgi:hypothetical protein
MSSLDKMLGILGLFSEQRTRIRLEDVTELTQASRATAYRYLQSLTEAGLLAPATGGTHALGPRIVELDRLMRMTDPLLTGAAGPLRELAARLDTNVMLCSYYGDKVMCVDLVWPDRTVDQAYERGRPMPMFGAPWRKRSWRISRPTTCATSWPGTPARSATQASANPGRSSAAAWRGFVVRAWSSRARRSCRI